MKNANCDTCKHATDSSKKDEKIRSLEARIIELEERISRFHSDAKELYHALMFDFDTVPKNCLKEVIKVTKTFLEYVMDEMEGK
jgi:uncharacterized coiled-coil protein SlyX